MTVLFERERELAELGAVLCEAAASRGAAVSVEAGAGLGKTSLLQEVRRAGAKKEFNVLSARATELEREFPFALVRQLFESELMALGSDERVRLLEGAGAAKGALGLDSGDDPTHDSFAVLHGLYWVTVGLAEQKPLLLAVDDAHHADAASLAYLGFLLPRLEELSVLLVVACRPEEPDSLDGLDQVLADPSARRMSLAPLSQAATLELLEHELGRAPEPAFGSACYEVSGGNPFFLSELVRTIVERGIEPVDQEVEAVGGLAPGRVSRMVLRRLKRLSPEAGKIAESLGVLGDGSDLHVVADLAGTELSEAQRATDDLRGGAIFAPGATPRFMHPLVRNAVYMNLPVGERARMHAQAANLLRLRRAPLEQVATHLLASEGRGDRELVETLIEVGERSLGAGAPRSAIAYLTRAMREPPPEDLRAAVLEPLMIAISRVADHAAWAAVEPEINAQLEREPSLRSRWAVQLTMALAMAGRFEEAVSLLVDAVEVAIAEGDVERAFQLEAQLNTFAHVVPSVPEVDLSRYVDRVDPDSPGGRLAAAIEARSAVVELDAEAAADAAKRALGNEGIIFVEEPELVAAFLAAMTLVTVDDVDGMRHAAVRAIAIARERDDTPAVARGLFLRGLAAWADGELAAAEADLRQALDLARLAGIGPLVLTFAGPFVVVLVERDELKAADGVLQALGMATGPMSGSPMFSMLLLARGHLRLERGELEAALEDFLAISNQANQTDFGPGPVLMAMPFTARAFVATGERAKALELVDYSLPLARRWGAPGTVAHVLRGAAIVRGGKEGIELLEEAVAVTETSPRRLERAHVLLELGEARRRQGSRLEARAPLREAFELARRCGAARIAKRALAELKASGETVRRYTPIGVESLTPSERRVAELAASGMTNRQIAQSLFVTLKTVESHLSAAYRKLDIGSRGELGDALNGRAGRSAQRP
jgi:DNA-binding CsgD family transcriptional regulator